jgi:hypothetical protein
MSTSKKFILLRDRDISTTQRYTHHYPESLRSSVEILDLCDDFGKIGSVVN